MPIRTHLSPPLDDLVASVGEVGWEAGAVGCEAGGVACWVGCGGSTTATGCAGLETGSGGRDAAQGPDLEIGFNAGTGATDVTAPTD